MKLNQTSPMMRIPEVAAELGRTRARVYQLVAARQIPAVRIGGALYVPRAAWSTWLNQQANHALRACRLHVAKTPKRLGTPAAEIEQSGRRLPGQTADHQSKSSSR